MTRKRKDAVQNRRRDVIRNISVHAKRFGSGKFREIGVQNVGFDERDIWPVRDAFAESGGKLSIKLNRNHSCRTLGQELRHFSVARANFDPGIAIANGQHVRDTLSPGGVAKKVLPEWSGRHGGSLTIFACECMSGLHRADLKRKVCASQVCLTRQNQAALTAIVPSSNV